MKHIKKKKDNSAFLAWCLKEGPKWMRLIKARDGGANPFTFHRKIEVPARLGKSGTSLSIPIPDQISKPDGSGPVSPEAFAIWASEVWKLLRGEWEKTPDGLLYSIQESLDEFEKVQPEHAKKLRKAILHDMAKGTFMFDGGREDSVKAFGEWVNNPQLKPPDEMSN